MHVLLFPFKGHGAEVVAFDEAIKRLAQLSRRGKAGPVESLPTENAEPALDLVKPTGPRRGKVKMHVWMTGPPAVVLGLMGTQIVHDHMNRLLRVIAGYQLVQEVQELAPPSSLPMVVERDLARQHVEGGEQCGRAMPLVVVTEAPQRLAIGQSQITLGTLQDLNVRFLVHRQHHGILRRVQVDADDVRRLGSKRRVGADAPTASPGQLDTLLAQNAPDLPGRYIPQGLRQP